MRKLRLLIPILILIIFSCKKEGRVRNLASLSEFPLATGDTWNYQITDSINNTTTNAVFTITGSYMLSGVPINVTHYTTRTIINGSVVDSGEIINLGDSVIYQPNGQGIFSNLTLLFPLTANNWWHTQYVSDSVFVIAANFDYTVLTNTYDSVYNVGRIESVPDLYVHQTLYIAPHVGIIQQTLNVDSWVLSRKTLRLVSYNLH